MTFCFECTELSGNTDSGNPIYIFLPSRRGIPITPPLEDYLFPSSPASTFAKQKRWYVGTLTSFIWNKISIQWAYTVEHPIIVASKGLTQKAECWKPKSYVQCHRKSRLQHKGHNVCVSYSVRKKGRHRGSPCSRSCFSVSVTLSIVLNFAHFQRLFENPTWTHSACLSNDYTGPRNSFNL